MASQDSGVETGNDSNDSCYPVEGTASEQSPNFRYQPASLSSQIQAIHKFTGTSSTESEAFHKIIFPLDRQTSDPSSNTFVLPHCFPFNKRAGNTSMAHLPEHFSNTSPRSKSDVEADTELRLEASRLGLAIDVASADYTNISRDYLCGEISLKSIHLLRGRSTCQHQLKNYRESWSHFKTPRDERNLRRAVSLNNAEEVERLLNIGVNPNSCDQFKRSPLHLASCRGYSKIVTLLLSHGADPNKKDSLGNTPLHIAACTNDVETVTLLIKAGTDISSGDNYGRNPLHLAESKLRLLQRHGMTEDSLRVKAQVQQVVEMMKTFFNKRGQDSEAELLSAFSTRLNLSDTPAQVEIDVRDLLASLSSLSLGSTSK